MDTNGKKKSRATIAPADNLGEIPPMATLIRINSLLHVMLHTRSAEWWEARLGEMLECWAGSELPGQTSASDRRALVRGWRNLRLAFQ